MEKEAVVKYLVAAVTLCVTVWAQDSDTVLLNGKILTADGRFSTEQALAVRDGKILAAGDTAAIRKLAGRERSPSICRALPSSPV